MALKKFNPITPGLRQLVLAKARSYGVEFFQCHGECALTTSSLKPCRDIDHLALFERDDRFLEITLRALHALEALGFTLADQRVDRDNLDVEKPLYGFLDL